MKYGKKIAVAMLAGAALFSSFVGVSHAQEKKIGVMIFHLGVDPFMSAAVKVLEEETEKLGYQITVADGHNDVAQMNAAVDQFVLQGMDGIIVVPSDPDSLVGSVLKAREAGKPVVAFNLAVAEEANLNSFITADEVHMGSEQAKMAVKALGGKGNVAIMMGQLGTSAQLGRTKGQHEIFDKESGIKIVEEQVNDWQNDKTVALIQNWLSKYPKGQLDAVLAHGPEIVAAAEYAKSQGRDEVKFFGIDYPEDARVAIQEGTLFATVNQDPKLLARTAVGTLDKVIKGEPVEKLIVIDTPVITKDNVEQMPAAY